MEQLSKLNKNIWIFILPFWIITNLSITGCKASHKKTDTNKSLEIGDTLSLTGYIIYDNKKGIASFSEINNLNTEKLSKSNILKLFNISTNIILLRRGLEKYKDSEFISLTLCNKDQKLIVKNNQLLYGRFYIVRLENFLFYKVNRTYIDNKRRLVFCEKE
jgi:hypothetical protein